jgi:hypothetical protein
LCVEGGKVGGVNNSKANGAEVPIGKSGNDGDHAWCVRGGMNADAY